MATNSTRRRILSAMLTSGIWVGLSGCGDSGDPELNESITRADAVVDKFDALFNTKPTKENAAELIAKYKFLISDNENAKAAQAPINRKLALEDKKVALTEKQLKRLVALEMRLREMDQKERKWKASIKEVSGVSIW